MLFKEIVIYNVFYELNVINLIFFCESYYRLFEQRFFRLKEGVVQFN